MHIYKSASSPRTLAQQIYIILLMLMPISAHATTYYFSNSGNDTNVGISPSAPFATVAKANAILSLAQPGDSILFQAGSVFRDTYLQCGSAVFNSGSLTLANHAPACSGVAGHPVTIGSYGDGAAPVFDAADPLVLSWNAVYGFTSVYRATLPANAAVPQKLYVDCAVQECPQILPVPNATGAYNAGRTYKYLDEVTYNGSTYVYGATTSAVNLDPTQANWINISNGNAGNATQTFPANNTGIQNVRLGAARLASGSGYGYPSYSGAFWYDGQGSLYVHLADGSNPNSHSFEATHRSFGIILQGVNYVTVTGLTFEHAGNTCGLSLPYTSDKGTYFVGENNTFNNVHVWNCSGIAPSTYAQQENTTMLRGGIVIRGDGQYNPHLPAGNTIVSSYIGQLDNYFAVPNENTIAGAFISGQDGGGAAANCVLCLSKVEAVTGPGLVYSSFGTLNFWGTTIRNNGGRVAGNEFTKNQGNVFFGDTVGGSVDTNYVHESFAEGIQLGGNSLSQSGALQTITGNVIVNLGKGASQVGYNGIDCNSTAQVSNVVLRHNTIWNTWGAGATFEGSGSSGCIAPIFEGNIVGQAALAFPAQDIVNRSYIFYTSPSVFAMGGQTFTNNLYELGGGNNFAAGFPSFSDWFTLWSDRDSATGDPKFVNAAGGDWRLQANSPALGLGPNGEDAGALPYNGSKLAMPASSLNITNPALP